MITSIEFDRLLGQVLTALAAIYFGRTALGGLLWLAASLPGRIGAASRVASARITPALVRRALTVALGTTGAAAVAGTGLAHAMQLDRAPVAHSSPSTSVGVESARPDFAPTIDRISRSHAPRPRPPLSETAVRLDRAPCPDSYPAVERAVGNRTVAPGEQGPS